MNNNSSELTLHSTLINQLQETSGMTASNYLTSGRSKVWALKQLNGVRAIVRFPNGRFKTTEDFADMGTLKATLTSGAKLFSADGASTQVLRTLYTNSIATKQPAVVHSQGQVSPVVDDTLSTEAATDAVS